MLKQPENSMAGPPRFKFKFEGKWLSLNEYDIEGQIHILQAEDIREIKAGLLKEGKNNEDLFRVFEIINCILNQKIQESLSFNFDENWTSLDKLYAVNSALKEIYNIQSTNASEMKKEKSFFGKQPNWKINFIMEHASLETYLLRIKQSNSPNDVIEWIFFESIEEWSKRLSDRYQDPYLASQELIDLENNLKGIKQGCIYQVKTIFAEPTKYFDGFNITPIQKDRFIAAAIKFKENYIEKKVIGTDKMPNIIFNQNTQTNWYTLIQKIKRTESVPDKPGPSPMPSNDSENKDLNKKRPGPKEEIRLVVKLDPIKSSLEYVASNFGSVVKLDDQSINGILDYLKGCSNSENLEDHISPYNFGKIKIILNNVNYYKTKNDLIKIILSWVHYKFVGDRAKGKFTEVISVLLNRTVVIENFSTGERFQKKNLGFSKSSLDKMAKDGTVNYNSDESFNSILKDWGDYYKSVSRFC